ncbi:putative phospholipase D [Paratrimastix pyriformis]|uniref:Phospholipase D n=1 Tax=Paratrimastix pyriformis TaxID=342808 RepID=A0ABQ8UET4_9EUKA|nr:putative phospholipase D [Paratrimastix pyriformis]
MLEPLLFCRGRVFKEDEGAFALDEIITPECHPRLTLDPTSHAASNIILTLNDIQRDGPMGIVAHGHELTEGEEYCLPTPVTVHLGAPSTAGGVRFRGTLRYRPAPGACDPDQFNRRPATAASPAQERLLTLGSNEAATPLLGRFLFPAPAGMSSTSATGWLTDTVLYVIDNSGLGHVMLYDTSKNFSLVGHLKGLDGGGSAQFMSALLYKATALHPPIVQSNRWNGGRGALIMSPAPGLRRGELTVSAENAAVGNTPSGTFGQKFYYLSNGDLLIMYMDYGRRWDPGCCRPGAPLLGPRRGLHRVSNSSNSLVGGVSSSRIGWHSIPEWVPDLTELPDGSYLLRSPQYYADAASSMAGAVTWCAGGVGCTGILNGNHSTSLVGSHANDQVGNYLRVFSDGTYVVSSPAWYSNRGFVAVGNSTHPVAGVVSAANSLLGASAGDKVGYLMESQMFRSNPNMHFLENGTFVVVSYVGAHVFFNPRAGIVPVGAIDETNALLTGALGVFVYLPVSQTFVIANTGNNGYAHSYSGATGAGCLGSAAQRRQFDVPNQRKRDIITRVTVMVVPRGNGVGGAKGEWNIADVAQLRGTAAQPLSSSVLALTNGNYVLYGSSLHDPANSRTYVGFAMLCTGAAGCPSSITSATALVGGASNDRVSHLGVLALPDGGYVVGSPGKTGSVTYCPASGCQGVLSATNSLVGLGGVLTQNAFTLRATPAGGFVVGCPTCPRSGMTNAGIVARCGPQGAGCLGQTASPTNSLSGDAANTKMGFSLKLSHNGSLIIAAPGYASTKGAVFWYPATEEVVGQPDPAKGLVGTTAGQLAKRNIYGDPSPLAVAHFSGRFLWRGDTSGRVRGPEDALLSLGVLGCSIRELRRWATCPQSAPVVDARHTLTFAGLRGWRVGVGWWAQVGDGALMATPNEDYIVWSKTGGFLTWCSGVVGCRGVTVAEADTITGIPTTIDPTIKTRTGGDGDYYIPLLSSFIWSACLLLLIIDTRYLRHETRYLRHLPLPAWLIIDTTAQESRLRGCGVGSGPKDRAFPKGPLGPTTALMDIAKGDTTLIDLYNGAFLVACSGSLSYAGSITWCSGTDPCVGTASAARSLVGAAAADKLRIGSGGESACPAFPPCDGWRARPWLTPLPIPHCVSACLCRPGRQLGDLGATLSTTVTLGPNATQPLYYLVRWSSTSTTASSMTICPTASGCAGVVTDPAVSLVGTSTMRFKSSISFVETSDLIRFLPNGNIILHILGAPVATTQGKTYTLCIPSAGCNGTLSAENTFGGNPGTHLTMPPAGSPEYAASSFYAGVPDAAGGLGALRLCSGVTFDCANMASFTAANSALGSAAHPKLGYRDLFMGPNGLWVGHDNPAGLSYLALVNGQLPLGTAVTADNYIAGDSAAMQVDAATGILVDSGSTRSVQVGLTRRYHSHFEQVAAETDGERVVMRFWVDEPVRMVGWTATMTVTNPDTPMAVTQNLVFNQTGRATLKSCSSCSFEAGSFPGGKKYPARISLLAPAVFFDKPVWDTVLDFGPYDAAAPQLPPFGDVPTEPAFDPVTPFTPANCYAGVSEPCEVHIKAKRYSLPAQVTLDGQSCQVMGDSTTSDLHVFLPSQFQARTFTLELTSSDGLKVSTGFAYLGTTPEIYSAGPSCPPEGCMITITGTGFYNPTVFYGSGPLTCPSWTGTTIICQMPEAESESGTLLLQNGNYRQTGFSYSYSYNPSPSHDADISSPLRAVIALLFLSLAVVYPTIDSVDPAQVEATGGDITIHGHDFIDPTVTMEGRPCPIQSATPTVIVCTAPPAPKERCRLTVQIGAPGQHSDTVTYTYNRPWLFPAPWGGESLPLWASASFLPEAIRRPVIASVGPTCPLAGGCVITITGSDFVNPTVQMASAPLNCTAATATEVNCTVPAGTAEHSNLTLINLGGYAASVTYTYQVRRPVIASVGPACPLAGGCVITIAGSDFDSPTVTLASAPLTCTAATATEVNCTVPAGTAEHANLTLINLGGYADSVTYTYQVRTPILSGCTPASCPAATGCLLALSGSAFELPAVTLGGTLACTLVSAGPTLILAQCGPSALRGPQNVTVTNTGGRQASRIISVQGAAPTFASVTPSAGPALMTAPASLTIAGAGFWADPASGSCPTAAIGAAACTVTACTATSLTCVLPASTTSQPLGAADLVVTNPDGVSGTLLGAYTFQGAWPSLTAVSPAMGPLAGGQLVTVVGTGMRAGARVTLGGAACTGVALGSGTTSLTCTTPAGAAAGLVGVTLTNSDLTSATLAAAYAYQGAVPTLGQVWPVSGPTSGATGLTLSGTGFRAGATVLLGSLPCTGLVVHNQTTITCTSPPGAEAKVNVTVANADLTSATLPQAFEFTPVGSPVYPPVFISISPATCRATSSLTVTLICSNVRAGVTVTIGGRSCTGATIIAGTRVRCVVPAGGTVGSADVTVRNTDGLTTTAVGAFTFTGPTPAVGGVSPSTLAAASGPTTITVTGSDFRPGCTVRVGSLPCTGIVIAADGNSLQCTVNPTATATAVTAAAAAATGRNDGAVAIGPADVVVTNADGTVAVMSTPFYFQAEAPTLSGVSPRRGSFKAATRVTLTGTHLRPNATVLVGGRACLEVEVLTGETVRAYVPPPPEGTPTGANWVTDVQLLNYDMTSATLGDAFTYVAATATAEGDDLAGGVSGGSVALFVVGALMLVGGLLAVLATFLVRRRRRRSAAMSTLTTSSAPVSLAEAGQGQGEAPSDSKAGDVEMVQMNPMMTMPAPAASTPPATTIIVITPLLPPRRLALLRCRLLGSPPGDAATAALPPVS